LFPKASFHFVHSSYAIHWLSKVSKELTDKNSPAWNSFLNARGQDLIFGGLMILIIPCLPDGIPSQCPTIALTDLFQSCLEEMVDVVKF
jgi:hypothetical protein